MMSRNDARRAGRPEEPTGAKRERPAESERLEQPGAGARVTGVQGVGAPDVTDHDVPARKPDDDTPPPIDSGAGS
jgi:hypothetical protein